MPKTVFRRGFKAEADRYATEFRQELGVPKNAPLCPWRLSNHLHIPIMELSKLPESPERNHLIENRSEFSAVAIFKNRRAMILNNDAHVIYRQASNLAHEIAHIVLGHEPTEPFDAYGKRQFPKEIEDEANWFGPNLLLSNEAAMNAYKLIASNRETIETLSKKWLVSEEVIRMRINLSGAKKRIGKFVSS